MKLIFLKTFFLRPVLAMILLGSLLSTVKGQQKFLIKGKLDEVSKGVKLELRYNNKLMDSAIIKDGKFTIRGTVEHPYKAYISVVSMKQGPAPVIGSVVQMTDARNFFLSAGTTTIEGKNLASAIIHNPVQDEYLELESGVKPIDDQNNALRTRIYFSKDPDSIKEMKEKVRELSGKRFQAELDFVTAHPDSYVSMDLAAGHGLVIEDPVQFDKMFSSLSPRFQTSPEGIKIGKALAMAKRLSIGQPAIEFTQNDVQDKPLSLSSLKGKYVLVDFWASWCGPCKMEYPFLHKAYDKYKGKNFEIIGVSLDSKKDVWVNSIKDNKFEWLLVCDLKGFANEAAVAYGVHAIPQSFLLDPQGVIIAKNLRGDDLIEKLDEVIKN